MFVKNLKPSPVLWWEKSKEHSGVLIFQGLFAFFNTSGALANAWRMSLGFRGSEDLLLGGGRCPASLFLTLCVSEAWQGHLPLPFVWCWTWKKEMVVREMTVTL